MSEMPMSGAEPHEQPEVLSQGEVVVPEAPAEGESVDQPAKVMRIGSMVKQLLDEVRAAPLDDASRERMREIYETSVEELAKALSPDLQEELRRLAPPFQGNGTPRTPSCGSPRPSWSAGWRACSTASRPPSSPSSSRPASSSSRCASSPRASAPTAPSTSAPARTCSGLVAARGALLPTQVARRSRCASVERRSLPHADPCGIERIARRHAARAARR